MASLSPQDPNSFSRPEEAVVNAFHWDVAVDFNAKILKGHVDLDVTKTLPEAEFLTLDSSKSLSVLGATCLDSGEKLDVDRSVVDEKFGVCTKIRLPASTKSKIRVAYHTSPDSSALQWMTKEQTAGKRQPYVYSHSEAIHSRALLPCQDSPNVKTPFTAKIRVPKGVTAVVSGVRQGEEPAPNDTKVVTYEQKVPVPVYLLAFAVGDLESRKIGPRSQVWSEKELVDKATVDFADTEQMLQTAETLMGDYVWGAYDLLVLPPSFPFGGMENPCLTFVTPTLLAGDKSVAGVVAHEIAHSWTGNLVTNKNFEHFWLNEGFTMYVERKLIGRMKGEDVRQFCAIQGLKDLRYDILEDLGENNQLTKLVVDLRGVDPDDSFSSVPYEKGHTFLYYLETLLGMESMEAFLRAYVERFKYKSIATDDFKGFLYEFFADRKAILDKIDWNAWLFTPGMPPLIPDYKSSLAELSSKLCEKWVHADEKEIKNFEKSEFDQLNAMQKEEFFALLLESEILSKEKVAHLTALYEIESIINAEIRFRWLRLGILSRWEGILKPATAFVEVVGRMKFAKPIFKDLGQWPEKRQYALDLYERLAPNMMYVLSRAVKDALEIRE
ncbi:leukotriene A-4 hydrolase [Galendromus occidentalis]|uniref:Leukotriene A-4 hydrolase n=1 Tax=Galendromus occidentalis TaxID=34638 RepID=A0AAJ6QSD1_9ACAR|nr:leukotriene A-4 hydrolase [Galendromus occidentalis]